MCSVIIEFRHLYNGGQTNQSHPLLPRPQDVILKIYKTKSETTILCGKVHGSLVIKFAGIEAESTLCYHGIPKIGEIHSQLPSPCNTKWNETISRFKIEFKYIYITGIYALLSSNSDICTTKLHSHLESKDLHLHYSVFLPQTLLNRNHI